MRRVFEFALRVLGSLRLAVTLIVLLAAALAWGTCLEAARGHEFARWYVYDSGWFLVLLAALSVNIVAAALRQRPWKRERAPFLLAHLGVLLLLAGAVADALWGVEGELRIQEGTTQERFTLTHRSQIRVMRRDAETGEVRSIEYSFNAGPTDWQPDQHLDFGTVNGVRLEVLRFYRHARREPKWVADESGRRPPAVLLAVGREGQAEAGWQRRWSVVSPFVPPPEPGELAVSLETATCQAMVDDFLSPPQCTPGSRGVLLVYYQGKRTAVQVDQQLPKKVVVGDDGAAVEIVRYLPNSQMAEHGTFSSSGQEPTNPMLDMRFHLPGRKTPVREVAFALNPLLTLAAMRNQSPLIPCRYYHPDARPPDTLQLLQDPDGRLFARYVLDGKYHAVGQVHEGQLLSVGPAWRARVLRHLQHAREEPFFVPVELEPGQFAGPEAAALVRLTVDSTTHDVWLARNVAPYSLRKVSTSQGDFLLFFGYEQKPLGFSLKLVDFVQKKNPGDAGDANYESRVQVLKKTETGVEPGPTYTISMNRPLSYGGFRFFQIGFKRLPGGLVVSVLGVSRDPGRPLKYAGAVVICLGLVFMYWPFRRRGPSEAANSTVKKEAAGDRGPATGKS